MCNKYKSLACIIRYLFYLQNFMIFKSSSASALTLLAQTNKLKLLASGLFIQFIMAFIIALIFFVGASGITAAFSAMIGAAVAILAQSCFLFFCFKHFGSRFSKKIVRNVFWGEALKILLVTLSFALFSVFLLPFINMSALLIGFALVYASQPFFLLFNRSRLLF